MANKFEQDIQIAAAGELVQWLLMSQVGKWVGKEFEYVLLLKLGKNYAELQGGGCLF